MIRSVHYFTLNRGRRAKSDFGQTNFIRELVQEVAQT